MRGSEANARALNDDDCSHLVDAAALILALDLNPNLLLDPSPTDALEEEPPRNVAGAPATADLGAAPNDKALPKADARAAARHESPTAAPPGPARLNVHAGARITLDNGALPRAALGVGPFVAVARGALAFEAQGTVYQEQFTVSGPRGGSAGAYVSLSTVSAHACLRALPLAIDVRTCLGGELGVARTSGVRLEQSEEATGLWTAATATLSARVLHERMVSPVVGVSFVRPLGAPTVYIERFGTVFEPAPVGVRGFLGLDVRFF
ncbi:hypothetical protein AKJ09_06496 [Labilithrix luteola]|uniref:Uncharacterized protein n=1 Tax=Labilithrix luteola TaxID=1391654 RepID=A0A0K1Q275_9BACT|nr:hypothetical protein AKJ09_06496 [Labilithrix luteola]